MRTTLTLVMLALVVAACGSATPADDPDTTVEPPLGAGPYPIADLEIVVEHPDRDTISYRVTCLGDTATITGETVVDEQAACLALSRPELQQRLVDGPGDRVCTEQYGGPDTATIVGTIDEQPVDTVIDRANGCGISDWDDLARDLLPPALGVTE